MSNAVKLLAIISRSEFLLPNLGSLIMGLAWGANPPLGLINGVILIILSFSIINLSSAIGAQANTLSDYELDLKDERKKELVQALDSFGSLVWVIASLSPSLRLGYCITVVDFESFGFGD